MSTRLILSIEGDGPHIGMRSIASWAPAPTEEEESGLSGLPPGPYQFEWAGLVFGRSVSVYENRELGDVFTDDLVTLRHRDLVDFWVVIDLPTTLPHRISLLFQVPGARVWFPHLVKRDKPHLWQADTGNERQAFELRKDYGASEIWELQERTGTQ
jgi:hypothetical protein